MLLIRCDWLFGVEVAAGAGVAGAEVKKAGETPAVRKTA